jgi:hypothetical protein
MTNLRVREKWLLEIVFFPYYPVTETAEVTMHVATLGPVLLTISIACTGCSSGGDGGGGSGGNQGSSEPISFDADTALPASGASAIAMATGAQLGLAVSRVIAAAAEEPPAAALGMSRKASLQLPGLCPRGGDATLDYSSFQPGQDVTLTFTGCLSSVFSGGAIDGTLVLTIEEVSGGFPSKATATVNLTVGSDTTITGSFTAIASLAGALLDLCLGDQRDTDILTITRGTETIEFACFKIRQVISLVTGAADGAFEPVGVVRVNGTQVFTLNSYTQQPPSVGFVNGTATSGSADMSSGDGSVSTSRPFSGPFCAPFGNTLPGNNSFIANEFAGDACVMVTGQDANGNAISHETTWSKLLNADFSPGGATCGGTTEAVPGPMDCDPGSDVLADADAYIQGDGPEGNNSDTPFGNAGNLVIKTVSNMFFTRKIYIVFDLSSFSDSFTKASLVLTLQRHVVNPVAAKSGPQPVNVFGIDDDNDWDPAAPGLGEDEIIWSNAPRNVTAVKASDAQFEQSPGVPLLIAGYDFDLGGDGVIDPPTDREMNPPVVTRYALDITEYVTERLENDADGKITILMAASNPMNFNQDGSAFFSLQGSEECDRPFLHFE